MSKMSQNIKRVFFCLYLWMILMKKEKKSFQRCKKIQNMLAHTEENIFILVIRFPHFLCVPSRTETFQAIQ